MFSTLFSKLSHLPVSEIIDDIVEAYFEGGTPIVTSEVASGKTMLIPAAIAQLADDVVYVLEPTRLLSNNAAESLRELLGEDGHRLIGCRNSNRSDDRSTVHKDNKIVFTTVGYALSAGIVQTAKYIIFDEAHETSIDLSLAKSIVHKRKTEGDRVLTAILSATIDGDNEANFWSTAGWSLERQFAKFTTKGSAFSVRQIHTPGWSYGECVINLLEEHNRRGILVFVEGKEEINEAINNIRDTMARNHKTEGLDFEICGISGNSTGEDRRKATAAPARGIKILVGTNVLESGISLPWVDGGVSNGMTKILYVNGFVHGLTTEPLPQWRMEQQMGRIGRFRDGVFLLMGAASMNDRPKMAKPDIVRLPLEELVMHCAKIGNIDVRKLQFSENEQPKRVAIDNAIDSLVNYSLVSEDEDGYLQLTEDGRMVEGLPVSYKAAAAYCEAVRIGELSTLIPLIAMIDIGDLRYDTRLPLGFARWPESDLVTNVCVIAEFRDEQEKKTESFRDLCHLYNMHATRLSEYQKLVNIISEFAGVRPLLWPYQSTDEKDQDLLNRIVKQTIFRAMINQRHRYNNFRREVAALPLKYGAWQYNHYQLSKMSVCGSRFGSGGLFATGNIRTITPKNNAPFNVMEQVTLFTDKDMPFLIERFGREVVDPEGIFIPEEKDEAAVVSFEESEPSASHTPRVAEVKDYKPAAGTLGDLLLLAIQRKKQKA